MSKFKVGDRVRWIGNTTSDGLTNGNVYTIIKDGDYAEFEDDEGDERSKLAKWVELIEPASDPVNSAVRALDIQEGGNHYKKLTIQPVEYMMANNIPFMEGSIIKYVTRWRGKGGIGDLRKARHVLDLLIENEEKANA